MPRIKIVKTPKLKKYQIKNGVSFNKKTKEEELRDINLMANNVFADEKQKEQNFANYMSDPRNEMTTTGWGQDFYKDMNKKTGLQTPAPYDSSKIYSPWQAPKLEEKKSKKSFGEKLSNTANAIQTGIGYAGAIANYFDNLKQSRDYNRWLSQSMLPDNYYAINPGGDRGDYDINQGMFRPNMLGYKSKGTQADAYYPQQSFAKYGGMLHAEDGMTLESDRIVQPAFLPSYAPSFISSANVPIVVNKSLEVPAFAKNENVPVAINLTKGFDKYAEKAQKYINKVNPKTDITGEMLAAGAQQAFEKYGKIVPVEIALAQLQQEGYLAKNKKLNKPQRTKNPFNYGNTDDGSTITFNNIQEGINTYFNLIAKSYLKNKTPEQLLNDFTNSSGNRYASDKNYENALKKIIKNINQSKEGGENINNKNMKIRITGMPNETPEMKSGGEPPYSGQSDYGLYIGHRNLYKTMAKHPYKDYDNSVTEKEETPEDPYVLEAEGGETILRPDGTHMVINGPDHSEGGVKMTGKQAPEGSFIYSKTAKMKIKDPNILKMFGKSKTSTPAQLAKQYNTNKYMAILNDPYSDPLQKNTAKRMIDAYQDKLAQIALLQEGKKGFPQGVPEVAKDYVDKLKMFIGSSQEEPSPENQEMNEARYGGVMNNNGFRGYQGIIGGSTVSTPGKRYRVNDKDINATFVVTPPAGTKPVPGFTDLYEKTGRMGSMKPGTYVPGYKIQGTKKSSDVSVEHILNHPEIYKTFHRNLEGAPDDVKRKAAEEVVRTKTMPGRYTAPEIVPGTESEYYYTEQPAFGETPPGGDEEEVPPTTTTTTIGIVPTDYTPSDGSKLPPYGWTQQDINNRNAALANLALIKKYNMASRSIQPVLPQFIPVDWRGQAAALQSGANTAAQQLANYSPGRGMASNLSMLAGQQAENLAKVISETDQWNAAGAAAMDAQRAQLLNQATQYNAAKRDYDREYSNIADAKYRAALSQGIDRYTAAQNQGITNAGQLYNLNLAESPEYYIDPRFQIRRFNSQRAMADFMNKIKSGSKSKTDNNMIALYNQFYEQAKGTPEQKGKAAIAALQAMAKLSSKSSDKEE